MVDDGSKPPAADKPLAYWKSMSTDEMIAYFSKVFKDPANATELLVREKANGGNKRTNTGHQAAHRRFRLFQFNEGCTNCEHIFRATHFLSYRLREKACLENPNFVFKISRHNASFGEMAFELALREPTLRGVSANTLFGLYERLIYERTRLETFLSTLTDGFTVETNMTRLAAELVELDDCIRSRTVQQKLNREGIRRRLIKEEEESDIHHNSMMLGDWTSSPHNSLTTNIETQGGEQPPPPHAEVSSTDVDSPLASLSTHAKPETLSHVEITPTDDRQTTQSTHQFQLHMRPTFSRDVSPTYESADAEPANPISLTSFGDMAPCMCATRGQKRRALDHDDPVIGAITRRIEEIAEKFNERMEEMAVTFKERMDKADAKIRHLIEELDQAQKAEIQSNSLARYAVDELAQLKNMKIELYTALGRISRLESTLKAP